MFFKYFLHYFLLIINKCSYIITKDKMVCQIKTTRFNIALFTFECIHTIGLKRWPKQETLLIQLEWILRSL